MDPAPSELRLARRTLDLTEWKFRSVSDADYDHVQTESALVFDAETRELVMVFLVLDDDCRDVEAAIRRINMQPNARANGMRTLSRIFGHQPRALPRRDFCTSASLAREDAAAHDTIAAYAAKVATYYERYNPERYAQHQAQTTKVLPEWRLKASPFTSGIVNKNNPLPYHYDSGNFEGVWSNMLAFKRGCTGGFLSVPEYNIAFAVPNNSLLMFDGQSLLHGVTPFTLRGPDSYRYTIVYYSLKQMWRCLPLTDEVIRAQTRRTEREQARRERRARR